jgi:hypothetical protein
MELAACQLLAPRILKWLLDFWKILGTSVFKKPCSRAWTVCNWTSIASVATIETWDTKLSVLDHLILITTYILILIKKPTRLTNFSNLFFDLKSTCFGQFLCPSSGAYHCKHSNSYMSYRLFWLLASKNISWCTFLWMSNIYMGTLNPKLFILPA